MDDGDDGAGDDDVDDDDDDNDDGASSLPLCGADARIIIYCIVLQDVEQTRCDGDDWIRSGFVFFAFRIQSRLTAHAFAVHRFGVEMAADALA